MAIYTQYGRYQKAKLFKEMLESYGDTYMLLGLGNPYWDLEVKNQPIPVAPYDTSHINPNPSIDNNQFLDANVNQYFSNVDYTDQESQYNVSAKVEQSLTNGAPNETEDTGKYLAKCKDLIPPFPCIWHDVNGDQGTLIAEKIIHQNDYQNYYISTSDYQTYTLNTYLGGSAGTIQYPTDPYERQFFSELVLRNFAHANCSKPGLIKHPAGLLGCVRCGISFVRDIGTSLDTNYVGGVDQFWYGDRYWEVVDPNEDTLESYINDTTKIYPHHLLFSATINPRQLFAENLNIDQNLIPREVAIFSKKLTYTVDGNDIEYEHGPSTYRVGEYIFNFGQYTKKDIDDTSDPQNPRGLKYETLGGETIGTNRILNFTFPCTINEQSPSDDNSYPAGDFKFILNDYIKGTIRNRHSVDRIGYIVGF